MKWFKRRRKAVSSADVIAFQLITQSAATVKDASQELEALLSVQERSQLPKVEYELLFFVWFLLDYWISEFTHTQEERRTIMEALSYHWRVYADSGHEGQALLDTLQERLFAYAQIVHGAKGDYAKFAPFGAKLSEFCGIGQSLFFLTLAPALFGTTMEAVHAVLPICREGCKERGIKGVRLLTRLCRGKDDTSTKNSI